MTLGILRGIDVHEQENSLGQGQFADITLSKEQEAAKDSILKAVRSRKPRTVLGGYAGTGKSTLLGYLALHFQHDMKLNVAYAAPTGKAAGVLRRSLGANGVAPGFCGTLHRLIYRPKVDAAGNITGWDRVESLNYDLIVIDEASMVTGQILEDLEEYGIPIIFCGDHGQLPPVGEEVNLMAEPDVRLETVRRQALENPIVALGFLIRAGGDWRKFVESCRSPEVSRVHAFDYMDYVLGLFDNFRDRSLSQDPMLICPTNRQRNDLNRAVRLGLRSDKVLDVGDRVICLKNTYLDTGMVANGFRGRVSKIGYARNQNHICGDVVFSDEGLVLEQGFMNRHQFGCEQTFKAIETIPGGPSAWDQVGLLFDYGYALTGHKSQGSQAEHAVVFAQRGGMKEDDWRRWLYTTTQRATHKLTLVY
jgi:exodeoxyribonuclease-5